MKPLPSRLKIALLSAGISGVVLVAFGITAGLLISRQKLESVDTEIRSLGARHPGWIANRGNYQRLDAALEFIFGAEHENQIILLVKDASDGAVLYSSPGWPADLDAARLDCTLADDPKAMVMGTDGGGHGMGRGFGPGGGGAQAAFTKNPKFQTMTTDRGEWRLGMLGTASTTLVIGLNLAGPHAELNRIRNVFITALPAALFLVGLGGWIIAGRALRPLDAIAETAERVTARGLDQRIAEVNDSPEANRLIQVLNRMMDRLEASFRQATRFSADASHELKTPLTVMQGELENALQAATPGSAEQQLFSNLLEEIQRLKNITRSLLLLAQADAGQLKLAVETVNLSAEMESMIEDARVLATDSRQQFDVKFEPQVWVEADRALLHTALFNLIHNAIKYNTPDGKISIRLNTAGDKTVFTIGNSGPGIPAADQPGIFERFYRVGRVNTPKVEGLGLGLSLAREIVRAHGGELSLKESRVDWTSFEVLLPRASRNG